jgi:uncharacterized membrane protein YczE
MKGRSVALELSRFLTALFNPQSLMSIGAFNCLLIVILSLMQSRKNSTFSAAMRYFAVGVFLAGWSMFSYVVTDSGSSARVLLSYCTHVRPSQNTKQDSYGFCGDALWVFSVLGRD